MSLPATARQCGISLPSSVQSVWVTRQLCHFRAALIDCKDAGIHCEVVNDFNLHLKKKT